MAERVIELKPMFYQSGNKRRGDREIWVDGVKWGYALMHCHGMHGVTFRFRDSQDDDLMALDRKGRPMTHTFESVDGAPGERQRWRMHNKAAKEDMRSTEQRIIDKALDLIAKDRLRDPAIIQKENNEAMARWSAARKKELAEDDLAKCALVELYRSGALTNSQQEGVAIAYRRLTDEKIEEAP